MKYLRLLLRSGGRIYAIFFLLMMASHAQAQVSIDFPTQFAGFSSQDVKITIQNVVRIIIGFLGVLVIIAIIYGGFKMMISRGEAEGTEEGRKIIVSGAIGLVIVLDAYLIANFVISSLQTAV